MKTLQEKYLQFRKQYPLFCFEAMHYEVKAGALTIDYHFSMGDIHFHPGWNIPLPPDSTITAETIGKHELLPNLLFHLGMIELISYWKSACSPSVHIKPFSLNPDQIDFWKKTYFLGLGEFFYVNGIDTNIESFLGISSSGPALPQTPTDFSKPGILLPIGGGKDSVVSLELLKPSGQKLLPLIVNPRGASLQTLASAGYSKDEAFLMYRRLDSQLLDLNQKGFLNGHTPFSAVLAFASLIAATLTGIPYIALSNESSANESTVANTQVNHQYSKSFEFESDFRRYVATYINPQVAYFSFLRPLTELQIAAQFSRYPAHFSTFKSCNVGSKEDIWCCHCPKCLFTYLMLAPFIPAQRIQAIFGSDLLDDLSLQNYLDELCGLSPIKPFECVGTIEEVNLALVEIIRQKQETPLPAMLRYYQQTTAYETYRCMDFSRTLNSFNPEHFVPSFLLPLLKPGIC